MVLSLVWMLLLVAGILCSILTGQGQALTEAIPQGAQSAVTVCISIAGSLCLWTGVGRLMEHCGLTGTLSRLLRPVLHRLFPSAGRDEKLSEALSANVCANLLGLGNAATPMGIEAAKRLRNPQHPQQATDELCRFIVLNTASIQLLPTSVAAVRSGLGSAAPFAILPAVWLTSILSAGLGLTAAWLLGKLVKK